MRFHWIYYLLALIPIGLAAFATGWIGFACGAVLALLGVYGILRSVGVQLTALERATKVIAADPPVGEASSQLGRERLQLSGNLDGVASSLGKRVRRIHEDKRSVEAVLAALPEGVVVLYPNGEITLMNRTAKNLLGFDADLVETSNAPLLRILRELAEKVTQNDEPATSEFSHEHRRVHVTAMPLEAFPGILLIIDDVTEVRQLETIRRDFVANVSHELKTPLTAIRAYVETLIDGGLDDTVHNRRFLEKIDANARRLSLLLTDLLTLSRIESGKAIGERTQVDVCRTLADSYQRLATLAEEKQIEVEVTLPSEPLHLLGDVEALQQILDNLIANAIKYTEPEGHVTIAAEHKADRIIIEVVDTGIGIPEDDLPRIFERFYRVDKARSREQGGTGLGLSIVKHYTQALDGEIKVTSTVGKGSKFSLEFPSALRSSQRPEVAAR